MKNWAIDITIRVEAKTLVEAWAKANEIANILIYKNVDVEEVSEPEQI